MSTTYRLQTFTYWRRHSVCWVWTSKARSTLTFVIQHPLPPARNCRLPCPYFPESGISLHPLPSLISQLAFLCLSTAHFTRAAAVLSAKSGKVTDFEVDRLKLFKQSATGTSHDARTPPPTPTPTG
jgi:hypothetical protein